MNKRVSFFGISIDNLSMQEAIFEIEKLIRQKKTSVVVTPNVQHINIIQKDEEFKKIYQEASLVLSDSIPLIWASKIIGLPIKERVAGSDLFPAFCQVASKKNYKIFLLGAELGIAKKVATILKQRNPGLAIVGTYSPPFGFEHNQTENEKIIKRINESHPDVLFLGLGTPKQEKWCYAHKNQISVPVIICVGASFDFIAGKSRRAPLWMQRCGLEWLHRFSKEPRRLWKRYVFGNSIFIWLVIKEYITKKF